MFLFILSVFIAYWLYWKIIIPILHLIGIPFAFITFAIAENLESSVILKIILAPLFLLNYIINKSSNGLIWGVTIASIAYQMLQNSGSPVIFLIIGIIGSISLFPPGPGVDKLDFLIILQSLFAFLTIFCGLIFENETASIVFIILFGVTFIIGYLKDLIFIYIEGI